MSFSSNAKAELCRIPVHRRCCALAECYGILLYSNTFRKELIRIVTENGEFAARLPMKYKLHGKERKKILKMAFPEFITPELAARPKRGFGVPIAAWLRESWKAPAEEKLFSSRLISEQFVNPQVLKRLWDMHQSDEADYSYLLWELIVLDLFLERVADRSAN